MRFHLPSELKSRVLAATGLLGAAERAARGAAILMYHGVLERLHGDSLDEYCVTADELRSHVRFLQSRGCIVALQDLVERLQSGQPVPNDWYVLTFDDALRCQTRFAREVLAAERVPWTLAVPSEVIEQRRSVWTYEVRFIIQRLYSGPVVDLPGPLAESMPTRTHRERLAAATTIVNRLADLGDGACRQAFLDRLVSLVGPQRLADAMAEDGRFVSADWEELQTLERTGVTIAAHGAAHVLQNQQLTDDELHREIHGARQRIKQRVGRDPWAFALPGGRRAPQTDRLVREAGYACCLGSLPARVTAGTNLFDLPRFDAAFSLPTLRRHLTRGAAR